MAILKIIIKITHILINNNRWYRIKGISNKIYSYWIQNEFKNCGKGCFIKKFLFLKGGENITLGNNVYIGEDFVLETYRHFQNQSFSPCIVIGNNSSLGDNGHITCINKITIGNNVLMGRKVLITDNAHGASQKIFLEMPPTERPLISKGPIIIEDNVWIGEMACIMSGVTIGKGSIIGANAVVTKSIPPYCIAVGNPARVIKKS